MIISIKYYWTNRQVYVKMYLVEVGVKWKRSVITPLSGWITWNIFMLPRKKPCRAHTVLLRAIAEWRRTSYGNVRNWKIRHHRHWGPPCPMLYSIWNRQVSATKRETTMNSRNAYERPPRPKRREWHFEHRWMSRLCILPQAYSSGYLDCQDRQVKRL